MRKNFGVKPWMYPLPVLMIGTYDKNGNPDVMNAAWGGLYEANMVELCLSGEHKTTKNIKEVGAFTISFATVDQVVACDYVGIVSGNNESDKLGKAGFSVTKSEFVNAPIVDQLPMCLECKLVKFTEDGNVIGEIVNVNACDSILDVDGKIDVQKLHPISFDPVRNEYLALGHKVGNAFNEGNKLK